jgi:predicted DNA-binding protein with PD1-like motif
MILSVHTSPSTTLSSAWGSKLCVKMRALAFRAEPGQDLKKELVAFVIKSEVHSACVLTCVGSLQSATLRLADHSADKPQSASVV